MRTARGMGYIQLRVFTVRFQLRAPRGADVVSVKPPLGRPVI